MNIMELIVLQQNLCQLISMNSFLTGMKDEDLAKLFADTDDQTNDSSSIQSVLFIMKMSHMTDDTCPFAFVQHFSCNPSEKEVLFSIATIFEVKSVVNHERTWHVTLQLNEQENIICRELSDYMIKQIGPNSSELSLGWLLYRMNDLNEASKCLSSSNENYDRALGVYKKTQVQSIAALVNSFIANGDSSWTPWKPLPLLLGVGAGILLCTVGLSLGLGLGIGLNNGSGNLTAYNTTNTTSG
ncbi:unnamed protein product [Adineta ricciae]|uniref:NAD(P)(+)--arginine ADP-ribosyltransferase n=1 Tax=Adineta ricciae TaxID=249248 RepID=A0A815GX38_ADIRI|nr:unnamed protein product [Adineta ricciae]